MRYETAEAFRTALEQRLKNEAQATGIALLRLRKRVAFERFLARLATSASSGWVLKGAFALELRFAADFLHEQVRELWPTLLRGEQLALRVEAFAISAVERHDPAPGFDGRAAITARLGVKLGFAIVTAARKGPLQVLSACRSR